MFLLRTIPASFIISLSSFFSVIHLVAAKYDYYYDQKPLIVSPYLQNGEITKAQELSRTILGNRSCYAGYFTTDEECGNNLYFLFFPALNDWETAPVISWVNGGPDFSFMFPAFVEIGPFNHLLSSGFVENPHTWTNDYNVLFVDQPVGSGFSFTEKGCYSKNMSDVAKNIYSALIQFLTMFPQLEKNKVLLAGSSMAGVYIPATAVEIDKQNLVKNMQINLKGIFVGSPMLNIRCNDRSDYLYELGVIDAATRDNLKKTRSEVISEMDQGNYSRSTWLTNMPFETNLPNVYNFMYDVVNTHQFYEYVVYIKDNKTRNLLHVGYTEYNDYPDNVYNNLNTALSINAGEYLEYLLNTKKYIVAIYTGQLDAFFTVSSVTCVLRSLVQWEGIQTYLNATTSPWYVSDRLAGWIKEADNLWEVVVRSAGQFVPIDQGEVALDLLQKVFSFKI